MFAIPIKITTIVGTLAVGAWFRSRRPGVMTAERDRIYRAAISGALKDPVKLRNLANAFERVNLLPQAQLLRQRAALRELPPEVKKARSRVFRQAMYQSTNKQGIYHLADVMDAQGCTNAAARLRAKADGLPEVLPTPEHDETVDETSDENVPVEATAEAVAETIAEDTQPSEPQNAVSVPVEAPTQAAAE